MNYHDREDIRQEIALEALRGRFGGRARIDAHRRHFRTRDGQRVRPHAELPGSLAGRAPDPAAVAEARDEIGSLPWHRAIRALRLMRGLGTAEAARRAGVSEHTICGIEAGRHRARAQTRQRVIAALGGRLPPWAPATHNPSGAA